jgi:hypothetical protein
VEKGKGKKMNGNDKKLNPQWSTLDESHYILKIGEALEKFKSLTKQEQVLKKIKMLRNYIKLPRVNWAHINKQKCISLAESELERLTR